MRTLASLCLLTLALHGCGGDSPTGPELKTQTFSFSLTDPNRCTCGDGLAQYTIEVGSSGPLEATATWQPADAVVVVRLLNENFTTIFATSAATGTTARLSHQVTPGTYRVQVFLGPTGGRAASYQLSVTHP